MFKFLAKKTHETFFNSKHCNTGTYICITLSIVVTLLEPKKERNENGKKGKDDIYKSEHFAAYSHRD